MATYMQVFHFRCFTIWNAMAVGILGGWKPSLFGEASYSVGQIA